MEETPGRADRPPAADKSTCGPPGKQGVAVRESEASGPLHPPFPSFTQRRKALLTLVQKKIDPPLPLGLYERIIQFKI
jgi:hypothetical protein